MRCAGGAFLPTHEDTRLDGSGQPHYNGEEEGGNDRLTAPPEEVKRRAGRPRSARSHQAILQATIELLTEDGFEAMSIEAIAARARVGKTTIYRRWANKTDLVIDALDTLRMQ